MPGSWMNHAESPDGTRLAAQVHGKGPPLVLLPAGPADCEPTWRPALPFLTEHFTCHLLDTRGRGESTEAPNHSPTRLIGDVRAYAESLDHPVGLAEWGSFVGGSWALFAAQETDAVSGVATYDPLVFGVAGEEDAARFDTILERVGELAGEGRMKDAGRHFVGSLARYGYYTEEDMVSGATWNLWFAAAHNVPMFLRELDLAGDHGEPDPSDPTQLGRTRVPVLLLHGERSHPMNLEFVDHVATHVEDARVRAIPAAGHYGPHTDPQAVAGAMVEFFGEVLSAS